MSRLRWIRSDVLALACRPSRARRATCPGWDLAPRADPERHARLGMSPFTSSSSDMLALACRPSRGFGATCSPWHVAPHACEVRHGSVCSVSTPLEQGDIHPLACGAARVGRATCRGPMGDGREREVLTGSCGHVSGGWQRPGAENVDAHAGTRTSPSPPHAQANGHQHVDVLARAHADQDDALTFAFTDYRSSEVARVQRLHLAGR